MPSPASLANLRPRPPWQPGQSGNARGKLATYKQVLQMARHNSPDAIQTLVQCMKDPVAPWPSRVAAAQHLLDRAWGKPKETVEIANESGTPMLTLRFVDPSGAVADETVTITQQPAPQKAEAFQLTFGAAKAPADLAGDAPVGVPIEPEEEAPGR